MKKVFLSFYFLCCGGTLVRLRVDISPLIGNILLSLLILYEVITICSNFTDKCGVCGGEWGHYPYLESRTDLGGPEISLKIKFFNQIRINSYSIKKLSIKNSNNFNNSY